MKSTRVIRLSFVAMLLIVTGCSNEQNDSSLALLKTTNPDELIVGAGHSTKDEETAKQVKEKVSQFKELYDVSVVEGEKEFLVAYKVKHMQRFHMKKIEKTLTNYLESHFPDEKFTVSSDYKIFLETIRLKEKVENGTYTNKEAEKRFEEIVKLRDELT